MENKKNEENETKSCPLPAAGGPIVYIKEGDLCPNCGFARLKLEPGRIIRCPICGYGNGAGCT